VSRTPIDFDAFEAVLLDLDGTVYFEEHALPGAVDLIRRLQTERRKYACLTNSTSNPERIAARLGRMGVQVDPAHIYTAAAAACDYVMERFAGQSALAEVGSDGVGGDGVNTNLQPRHPVTPHPVTSQRKPRVFNLSTEGVHEMLDGKVEWVNDEKSACDAVVCGVPKRMGPGPCAVALGTATEPRGDPRRRQIQSDGERHPCEHPRPVLRSVGRRAPQDEREHRAERPDEMEIVRPAHRRQEGEPAPDHQHEREQQRHVRAVARHGGEIEPEEERHERRDGGRTAERRVVLTLALREQERAHLDDREEQEDSHRERQGRLVEELHDPAELIQRRQHDRPDRLRCARRVAAGGGRVRMLCSG